jgi:hypothetical protein
MTGKRRDINQLQMQYNIDCKKETYSKCNITTCRTISVSNKSNNDGTLGGALLSGSDRRPPLYAPLPVPYLNPSPLTEQHNGICHSGR